MSVQVLARRARWLAWLVLAAPAAGGNVVVVTPSTPGGLQSALDAAFDGDTLLIAPGHYSECTVSGKALTLLADVAGASRVEGLHVSNVPAEKTFTVAGLDVLRTPATYNLSARVLSFDDCAGSVRLQSVTCQLGTNNWSPGLALSNCADVALAHCALRGSSDAQNDPIAFTSGWPMPGIDSQHSRVALYQCDVTGGRGRNGFTVYAWPTSVSHGPRAGERALVLDGNSVCMAHGCELRGGDGGFGLNGGCDWIHPLIVYPAQNGAAAGHGCQVTPGGALTLLGGTSIGGAGGAGGTVSGPPGCTAQPGVDGADGLPIVGASTTIVDTEAELVAPTHVRAGQALGVRVNSAPGDLALLVVSSRTRWLFDPALEGVVLEGPTVRRVILGTVPPSGTLNAALGPLALPGGARASQLWLQLLVRHRDGRVELGSPAFLTVLHPGL